MESSVGSCQYARVRGPVNGLVCRPDRLTAGPKRCFVLAHQETERMAAGGQNRNASPGSRSSLFGLEPLYSTTMSDTLVVNEIYLSLQGESTFAGLPCIFVRLTACNLRCAYCDTAYAFTEGKKWPLSAVLAEVRGLAAPFEIQIPKSDSTAPSVAPFRRLPLVELTGGEPLLQANSLPL